MHGPFWLRRPTSARLAAVLAGQADQPLTYADVGATLGDLPAGYRQDHYSVVVGETAEDYELARRVLSDWAPHRGSGIELTPDRPEIAEGSVVVQLIKCGFLSITAVCRIVWVIDEADRFGFAYGTLGHHAAKGEEAFMVERGTQGAVEFQITSFSRFCHPIARIGAPVTRLLQVRAARAYLDAMSDRMGMSRG